MGAFLLLAATIKPDGKSALIVVDVQNCFVDDHGEQGAPYPFSAMGPRHRHTAALRTVRVLERASGAYICERSKVPRSVVDRDS